MPPFPAMRAAITWLGHSSVVIELDGARVAIDPLLRSRVAHLRRQVAAVDPAAVGTLDAVLITHQHRDHLDVPSLRRLRPGFRMIVPRGAGRLLRRAGFGDVLEVEPGAVTTVGALRIEATTAVHDGRRLPMGPPLPALGYVLGTSPRVYDAGDTDLFDGMRAIGAPGLDVALLPISGWGPTVGVGHLDPARAARAAALLAPRICVPVHHGTYRGASLRGRTGEPNDHLAEFLAELARIAPEITARSLEPGETLELD